MRQIAITSSVAIIIKFLAFLTCTSETSALLSGLGNPLISVIRDLTWGKIFSDTPKNNDKIACKDEQGNFVDWFIVYKLPKIPDSESLLKKEGSAHYFLLPGDSAWKQSSLAINDSRSSVGRTAEPLKTVANGQVDEIAAVLYNDQPPDMEPTIRNGHSKGLMMANTKGGFWMPHSIPHFPRVSKTFEYPPGGLDNGQMLFCLSLPLNTINEVLGGALEYTKATFYNSSIPASLESQLSKIQGVIKYNKTASGVYYNQYEIGVSDLKISVFAKGPKFHREIYADWIAPYYNSSLNVQSWLNGAHAYLSNCTLNCSVYNVMKKTILGQGFTFNDDHSKWAVGQNQNSELTCIADLNRQKPQKGRGGVALCIRNKNIWSAFQGIVTKTQPCNSTHQALKYYSRTDKVQVTLKSDITTASANAKHH
ncbi:unnamed protein product [Allacma fusca]|uniref:Uncharacterized protein n=1 Tax=Allacma fusca TaxID=39272 RepID=A0A8J2P0N6_9HEXA|nr:unnamed protein product [Allacma fusca]